MDQDYNLKRDKRNYQLLERFISSFEDNMERNSIYDDPTIRSCMFLEKLLTVLDVAKTILFVDFDNITEPLQHHINFLYQNFNNNAKVLLKMINNPTNVSINQLAVWKPYNKSLTVEFKDLNVKDNLDEDNAKIILNILESNMMRQNTYSNPVLQGCIFLEKILTVVDMIKALAIRYCRFIPETVVAPSLRDRINKIFSEVNDTVLILMQRVQTIKYEVPREQSSPLDTVKL